MRFLLFFILFTTSQSFANYKLEIKNTDGLHQGFIEKTTEQEVKDAFKAILLKSTWMKCNWTNVQENSIATRYEGQDREEHCHPINFSIEITDVPDRTQELAIEEAIQSKIECGANTIKYISKLNALKGLTNEQVKQMATTYTLIFSLLNAGAIDTSIEEITALTPDGTIITNEDKTNIITFLNACN